MLQLVVGAPALQVLNLVLVPGHARLHGLHPAHGSLVVQPHALVLVLSPVEPGGSLQASGLLAQAASPSWGLMSMSEDVGQETVGTIVQVIMRVMLDWKCHWAPSSDGARMLPLHAWACPGVRGCHAASAACIRPDDNLEQACLHVCISAVTPLEPSARKVRSGLESLLVDTSPAYT